MHVNSLKTLRKSLLTQRNHFVATAGYEQAQDALLLHLRSVIDNPLWQIQSIALYWPFQAEVDLRPTLQAWVAEAPNRQLCLPLARNDKHLDFYAWEVGDTLIPSHFGIPEPDPRNMQRPQIQPDCILLPVVGWAAFKRASKSHFYRLGYGGGFFDRTLAQLRQVKPNLICIGIGFDWQKLDIAQWEAQAHDEPLNMMLTESGVLSSLT
jgi:5,10-methenyltetrahydrofolate synthetase